MDTLKELSQALNDDANFGTNVVNSLATKAVDTTVVHNSGDETINGNKSFTANTSLNNITYTGTINDISPTTFNYLADVTTPIQQQLNNLSTVKADKSYTDS